MALAAQRTDDVVRIDKFDGKNFHLWKFKMQMVLEDRDLWTIVSGEEEEPSGQGVTQAAQEKFRKRSRKALAAICLSLCDSQLLLVRSSTTAREAWLKLEGHYETKSLANKLFLRKRYLTTMMSDSNTMIDHINKLRSLAKQLDSVGAPVSAEDQVATLLCSLPDSYGNLIVALESRADDLTLEFVIARLLHEEKKRSETSVYLGDAMEKALVASKANPSSQAQKPSKKGKCFNCGIKGHWARDCKRPKRKRNSTQSELILLLRVLIQCFGQHQIQMEKKDQFGMSTQVPHSTCHAKKIACKITPIFQFLKKFILETIELWKLMEKGLFG